MMPAGSAHEYRGYLVHTYQQDWSGRTLVYGIGRLEDGSTFGFVDRRPSPSFYIRCLDRERGDSVSRPADVTLRACELHTIREEPVDVVTAPRIRALRDFADRLHDAGIPTYEADIPFHRQFRLRRDLRGPVLIRGMPKRGTKVDRVFINPELRSTDWEPALRVLALDIETTPEHDQVTAVSLVLFGIGSAEAAEEVHIIGDPQNGDACFLRCHADESALLTAVRERVCEMGPDIVTGWNVIDFDLRVLVERFRKLRLHCRLGRTRDETYVRKGERFGGSTAVVHGRQVVDAMHLIRRSTRRFSDYRLGTVAEEVLGRGKLLTGEGTSGSTVEAIERARREDRELFASYCLEDSRLVRDILCEEGLLELTLSRSMLTGLPIERAWGSVAAFDFLYVGELHKRGLVAPTASDAAAEGTGAPGGLVLVPKVGLHRHVLVFDFKSLYPSLMRTFNIDPLAYARADGAMDEEVIVAPNGARFHREPGILPGLLDVFFARRDEAKRAGDDNASFAYKIVMNSFYGVLGTRACRFGSSRLAGAITSFGHHMLRWCQKWLEDQGHTVLYGDTDSLFLNAGLPTDITPACALDTGAAIAARVNAALREYVSREFDVESKLELEFEKYYRAFLLPPSRGDVEKGRAKGYAGWRMDGTGEALEIVGLEAVRSDWTDMAHRLQRELLTRLFNDVEVADIESFVGAWVHDLKAGRFDDELVYRRRLRKSVESYTKTTPPHVKAARLLENPSGTIRYVMTSHGPQPVAQMSSPLDYGHYIEKQVGPLVRMVSAVSAVDADVAIRGELRLL